MSEIVSTWSSTPSDTHTIPRTDLCMDSLWIGKITVYISDKATKVGRFEADLTYNGTFAITLGTYAVSSGFTWLNMTLSGDNVIMETDNDCFIFYRFTYTTIIE